MFTDAVRSWSTLIFKVWAGIRDWAFRCSAFNMNTDFLFCDVFKMFNHITETHGNFCCAQFYVSHRNINLSAGQCGDSRSLYDRPLLEGWKMKVKVPQLCPTLCNPMDYTVHGVLQARILEWVAFPVSRGSSQSRDLTQISHIASGFFTNWAIRESQQTCFIPRLSWTCLID